MVSRPPGNERIAIYIKKTLRMLLFLLNITNSFAKRSYLKTKKHVPDVMLWCPICYIPESSLNSLKYYFDRRGLLSMLKRSGPSLLTNKPICWLPYQFFENHSQTIKAAVGVLLLHLRQCWLKCKIKKYRLIFDY